MATKRTINNESRDVKRKLGIIQKKTAELKELGVSVAVFYSSRKINGIQYFGDRRYTDVVDKHKDEILLNPAWYNDNDSDDDEDDGAIGQPKLLLPPLPCKLEHMNGITLRSAIAGLIKDLGLSWSSPKPCWWPAEIPYRHPKLPPDNYQGKYEHGGYRIGIKATVYMR